MDFHLYDKSEAGYTELIEDAAILDENIRAWANNPIPKIHSAWPDWRWNQLQTVPRSAKEAFGGGSIGAGEILRKFDAVEERVEKFKPLATFIRYIIIATSAIGLLTIAVASAFAV